MEFNPTMTNFVAGDVQDKLKQLLKEIKSDIKNGIIKSQEQLTQKIKSFFSENAIKDEELKFVGLAFSFDEGSAYLESGLDAYCSYIAKTFIKDIEKKEEEKPKAPYFIQFDKNILKTFKTKDAIRNYASQIIEQAISESGNKEGNPDKIKNICVANFENLNTSYGIQLSETSTALDALTDCLIVSQKELISQEVKGKSDVLPAHLQNTLDEYDKHNPQTTHERLHSIKNPEEEEKKNLIEQTNELKTTKKENEEEFDISEVGEGTGDINYFVGYDKEKVGELFKGRPALLSVFKEFVEKYNKLMNSLLNHELSPDEVKDLRNDIDPYFQKMAAVCSEFGGDGSLIKNLCDGMMTILGATFDAEIEGKNINGLKLKNDLQGNKVFDHTDNDGLRNDSIYSTSKPSASQTSTKAISSLVGYDELVSPENLEIMDITLGIDRDEILGLPNPLEAFIEELTRAETLGVLNNSRAKSKY